MVKGTDESMISRDENADDSKTALRMDIERTRANMSRTVDELEERLSPAHIKEQVADIKEAALGQYHEAKDHLKEDIATELRQAKVVLQQEIRDAKQSVQEEIQQARTAVREATVGRVEHMVNDARDTVMDAGTGVLETIKANPVPVALVAVGLGWLLVGGRSSASRRLGGRRQLAYGSGSISGYGERNEYGAGGRYEGRSGGTSLNDSAEGTVSKIGQRIQAGATNLASQVSDAAQGVGGRVSDLAHDAAGAIGHAATDARNAAVHFADDARMRGRDIVRDAGRQVVRAEQTFESTLRDNPLAVGAIAVAVGAAIGLALPNTQLEDEWMGSTKERLFERAEGLAEDALHKVERTVTHQLGAGGDAQAAMTKGKDDGWGEDETPRSRRERSPESKSSPV